MYDQVGGQEFFVRLVDAFYSVIEKDELLRPMYPEDLTEAKQHLVFFFGAILGWATGLHGGKRTPPPSYEARSFSYYEEGTRQLA